jgi:hypothetical protein
MSRFTRTCTALVLGVLGLVLTVPNAFAQPAPSTASTGDQQAADVFVVHTLPGGGRQEVRYQPAPGVTASELADSLRRQGATSVSIGAPNGAPKSISLAAVCALRTARTWGCPMPRWAYNGHTHPQVYFLDHTSSAWPVDVTVAKWNDTQGLDSWYRWYTKGCPDSTVHCVHVYSGNYGATGWTGLTARTVNSSNYITSAYIKLNDYYGGTAAEHRSDACHEEGHVLGLNHNTSSTTSCMYYARTSVLYPNGDDFSLLETYY